MNWCRIGIDPGKSGAIGIITDESIHSYKYDQIRYVLDLSNLKRCKDIFCVVENVHAMPKQGVSSSFNFGQNFGWTLGILDAIGVPYELVNPQKWKKEFSCTSDKNTSIECARRLFHGVSLRPTSRCTKDDDGMAESLLMAEYARRHY